MGGAVRPGLVAAAAGVLAVLTLAAPSGAMPVPPSPSSPTGSTGSTLAAAAAATDPSPAASPTLPPVVAVVPPTAAAPGLATTPSVTAAPAAATRRPDRVDRRWPLNPPWDACPRPVWRGQASTGLPGAGRRVLVIGDSLTRDSRVLSARGMRASGWTPTFRCWGSRRLDWGLEQVSRSRQLDQLPRFVVMALGTNDISWETTQTTERRVRALLDRLGPARQIVWVDLHLTRSTWLNARADWFNSLLDRLARTHPNLTVVHWHAVARAKGIRGWDGIHYGAYGYRLRAATLVKALNAVGREHPAAVVTTPTSAPPAPVESVLVPSPGPTALVPGP